MAPEGSMVVIFVQNAAETVNIHKDWSMRQRVWEKPEIRLVSITSLYAECCLSHRHQYK